jgi:hypothetical protein
MDFNKTSYLTGRRGKNVCAVANFMPTGSLLGFFVGEGEMNKDHAFFFLFLSSGEDRI